MVVPAGGGLDAPLIAAFLDHLEHSRGNTSRTRNARLAAIHSLFGYAAMTHPEHAADIARVLAIPARRSLQVRDNARRDRHTARQTPSETANHAPRAVCPRPAASQTPTTPRHSTSEYLR